MKYFVSADIHGFFDEWMTALKEKEFDIDNPQHKLIVCGDLFDRGRQPKEIIDFVLAHKDKIILIKGNHEDLMEEMIARGKNNFADLSNGTAYTIGAQSGRSANLIYPKLQKKQDLQKCCLCVLTIVKPNIISLFMAGYQ